MDNIIQITKICGERRLFHDLWITALLLLCFLFRNSSQNLFSKVAILKFCKIPWKTPGSGFLFKLQDIDLDIYRNWIARHLALGILKQLLFGIYSIDCCVSPVSSTIIFQIHTEFLLHVQLSLLRNIFCVISVDNKSQRGGQWNKIRFNLHVPRILEKGLKNMKIWKRNWRVLIYVVSQQFLLKFVQNKNFRLCRLSSPLSE